MSTEALERLVAAAAAATVDPDELRDRYRGVMLGLAVGNALGLSVEGASASAIRRRHPQGITEVDPAERSRPWDDDLAQAVILGEILCEREDFDSHAFGRGLVMWARENGRGMGALTHRVIHLLERGEPPHEAARRAWEESGWSTAGNGAVMRCAPVALRWRASGPRLVRAARDSALVTHHDARCEWSTVVVVVLIAGCLAGAPPSHDDLASAIEGLGGDTSSDEALTEVCEAIRWSDRRELRALELDDAMDMGYTLKAMQVALWCAVQEGSFETIVSSVVSAGGDTDTNAAVAGAVMGALRGLEAIPERWIENVARVGEIGALADRLYEQAHQRS